VGIFDALTGNASKRATQQGVQGLQQAGMSGAEGIYQGRDIASGILTGALNGLSAGEQRASSALTGGAATAGGFLNDAGAVYNPLVQGGQAAYGRLLDATGANGAEGSARATSEFRAAPGYEFARDEALGAVMRAAGARGDLAGGNATTDLLRTSTGFADQSYQQYVNNLSGLMSGYQTGLAGQAGALTGQAGLAATTGSGLANIAATAEQNRTGVLGQQAANVYNAGTAVAGQGNALAGKISETLQAGAKAQEQASANGLNLISNAIGGVANFVGGNGISNLSKLF
jgi:hypothetical protein